MIQATPKNDVIKSCMRVYVFGNTSSPAVAIFIQGMHHQHNNMLTVPTVNKLVGCWEIRQEQIKQTHKSQKNLQRIRVAQKLKYTNE